MTSIRLSTIGQIAEALGQPLHRVEYVVRTRGIEPECRVGNLRAFGPGAVERVRAELARSERGLAAPHSTPRGDSSATAEGVP